MEGDLIAMIPSRDSLLIAGSEDNASLAVMLALAKKAGEEHPRPLVPIPVRLDGDAWVDWMPDPSHALSAEFRELATRYLYQEYGEQKDLHVK